MSKIKSNIEKLNLIDIKPIENEIDKKRGRKRSRKKVDMAMVRIPIAHKELCKIYGRFQRKTMEEFLTDLIDDYCRNLRPEIYHEIRKLYKN